MEDNVVYSVSKIADDIETLNKIYGDYHAGWNRDRKVKECLRKTIEALKEYLSDSMKEYPHSIFDEY